MRNPDPVEEHKLYTFYSIMSSIETITLSIKNPFLKKMAILDINFAVSRGAFGICELTDFRDKPLQSWNVNFCI